MSWKYGLKLASESGAEQSPFAFKPWTNAKLRGAVRVGLAVDQASNDLFLATDGTLGMVTDAHAVGQHVRQRLQTFQSEWFLDTAAGVPWLTVILGRNYDPALAESVVKAEILATDGVEEILSFSVSFDRATRGLLIRSIEVRTMFDEVVSV